MLNNIYIEKALLKSTEDDEFHVKVAKTQEKIVQLLELNFEYFMRKDGLAYFRKRK